MGILEFVALSTFFAGLVALFTEAIRKFLFTIPVRLLRWASERFILSVTISKGDAGFEMLREWLNEHPYAKKTRHIKMVYDHQLNQFKPVPGHGLHWLWFEGPLWIRYGHPQPQPQVDDGNNKQPRGAYYGSERDNETYAVTLISPDHSKMNRFMNMLSGRYIRTDERPYLNVYTYHGGYWQSPGAKRKRDMKTVYLPEHQKHEVIEVITKFLAAESWYMARGIPWRIGLEFEGPPGTGKTTLATALAGYFNKPLFCLNLNNIFDDESLQRAFTQIPRDGIVLIEDIDSFQASQRREGVREEEPIDDPLARLQKALQAEGHLPKDPPKKKPRPRAKEKTEDGGVTLSGLLNAIDGVAATEGRILIMTTNDPEKLDPALVRAGRVDKRIVIGPLGPAEVEQMFLCFFPENADRSAAIHHYAHGRVKTASAWQALFIKYHDSLDKLFAEVIEAK